jgi:cephalosporin hydroxylase
MKKLIKKILHKFGIDIVRIEKNFDFDSGHLPYAKYSKVNNEIIDLDILGKMSLTIPGMITAEAGKFLYSLCYMQDLVGDVVEIGSWQGRSSIFLARAVKESKNGDFYAIDHFGGNSGKEKFYEVDGSLIGLKEKFQKNMSQFGLSDSVKILNMKSSSAAYQIKDKEIRFLFIDGDHTKSGVENDIALFFPLLQKGSIVVFDDYFEEFAGLIDAVDSIFEKYNFERVFYYRHTLVIKV